MKPLFPYIGGKARIAGVIVEQINLLAKSSGADTLVDVFGGSAAVTMCAGWKKRVYNDQSSDLVNLFSCVGNPMLNRKLVKRLGAMPPSREIFATAYQDFRAGRFSFKLLGDRAAERAARTIYHQLFCFGGKTRGGGFSVSLNDRHGIKEVVRYRNVRRRISAACDFWMGTVIENMDFAEIFSLYGSRSNAVLYCDPPYVGTERYYSGFAVDRHHILADLASSCEAHVVMSYYDTDLVRELYPQPAWEWIPVDETKNSQFIRGQKVKTDEVLLVRRHRVPTRRVDPQQQLALEAVS